MGVDPEQLKELLVKGWRCLNCGEHVPDSCHFVSDGRIECGGMCTSLTCRNLPPGGNPFFVVIE